MLLAAYCLNRKIPHTSKHASRNDQEPRPEPKHTLDSARAVTLALCDGDQPLVRVLDGESGWEKAGVVVRFGRGIQSGETHVCARVCA